jgi:hypothetical protein
MSCVIASLHANAEFDPGAESNGPSQRKPPQRAGAEVGDVRIPPAGQDIVAPARLDHKELGRQSAGAEGVRAHQFPATTVGTGQAAEFLRPAAEGTAEGGCPHIGAGESLPVTDFAPADDPERRAYRRRTVAMLRRYMRYSIETGRLPSVLGGEFFRAKVTSYTVVTFEDRVIFVHDMEICLQRLDEFSQQLIARHILQEHDHEGTARLLHCNEKTVRRLVPMVLDLLSDILLEVGLMESLDNSKKSCQGGPASQNELSHCEDGENKF